MEQLVELSAKNRVLAFEKVLSCTILYLMYKDKNFRKNFEPVIQQVSKVSGELFFEKLKQDAKEFIGDNEIPEGSDGFLKRIVVDNVLSLAENTEPNFLEQVLKNWCSEKNFDQDAFLVPENHPKFMDSILDFTNSIKK